MTNPKQKRLSLLQVIAWMSHSLRFAGKSAARFGTIKNLLRGQPAMMNVTKTIICRKRRTTEHSNGNIDTSLVSSSSKKSQIIYDRTLEDRRTYYHTINTNILYCTIWFIIMITYNLYISQYLGLQISKSSEFSSLKTWNSETKIVNWVNNGDRLIGRTYDKQPLLTSKSRGRLIRGSTYPPGSTVPCRMCRHS